MPSGNLNWKVDGLKELDEKLRSLPDQVEKKVLRGAVSAGAKVIRDDARRRIASRSGDLKDATRFTTSVKLGTGQAISKVFVSVKKAFYGRFVEFGTRPHIIKSKKGKALRLLGNRFVMQVRHPGAKPKPFMQEAADSQAANAVSAITTRIKSFFDSYHG